MQNKVKIVDAVESAQIVRELYLDYISKIDVGAKWELEYLAKEEPSICLKQIPTSTKTKEFMGGSYEAELPFHVYFKSEVTDTNDVLEITQVLNNLASTFEKETQSGFLKLKLSDVTPKLLEMTSTPSDVDGIENGVAIFGATYRLIYKKKGRFI